MYDITVTFAVQNSHLNPIDINIIYNDDGTVNHIDWREAILSHLDDILEEEYLTEDEDYISEDDPDYVPGIDTDDEMLEYTSNDDEDFE